MSVQEIEEAITALSPAELARFSEWFAHFEAQAWDRRIEDDSRAGRLDALIAEAQGDFDTDLCKSL